MRGFSVDRATLPRRAVRETLSREVRCEGTNHEDDFLEALLPHRETFSIDGSEQSTAASRRPTRKTLFEQISTDFRLLRIPTANCTRIGPFHCHLDPFVLETAQETYFSRSWRNRRGGARKVVR